MRCPPALSARLCKRAALYLAALLVYAFAACLMVTANVGISPLTSVAYIFTLFTPLTMGATQLLFNLLLIALQILILKRDFPRFQYLQVVAALVFSAFIDLAMPLAARLETDSLPARWLLLALALALMGLSITVLNGVDLVMLPGDGLPKAIARVFRWPFGKGKVLSDSLCALSTALISLAALGRVEGIQLGTVVAALSLGNIARLFMRWLGRPLQAFLGGAAE